MGIVTNILVSLHVVASALWVGAVFMGSIIDPPALRMSASRQSFTTNFITAQGIRIFPWVYFAMTTIFITGITLTWLYPPQNATEIVMLTVKFIALSIMAGNTLYGSLVTWPKIQFATDEEVALLWKPYLLRAYITLAAGLVAFAVGANFTMKENITICATVFEVADHADRLPLQLRRGRCGNPKFSHFHRTRRGGPVCTAICVVRGHYPSMLGRLEVN